jgi:cell wall-associated NlpC family hydrolase
LKPILYLLFIFLFFTSCKPTSAIITSKNDALKKGIYVGPIVKKTTKKKEILSVPNKKETIKKTTINEVSESDYVAESSISSYLVEQLINSATSKIGAKYRSGGITDQGFDCSGLMWNIFNLYSINLPRSSFDQSKLGVVVDKENTKKGDLIFFRTNNRRQINHVGMVIEINSEEIKFIHSSTSSGVIISSTKESYYQKSFAQINRILE